ncbi:MAG: response regulator transcription factor, partial [Armatimonadia bacterium]
ALCELLAEYMVREGFWVETVHDGDQGREIAEKEGHDLVVLDVMLPRGNGFEVLNRLRARTGIPVVILTARGEEIDRVVGLEMGADDYITKPFNAREVVARVKAVLRRARQAPPKQERPPLSFPQFRIDPNTREATVDGKPVALTPHEFDIVYLLATKPRQVFPRSDIMTTIGGYDEDYGDYRTVDTHLKRARQKLRDAGLTACSIETVWGIGYRFVPSEGGAEL